VSIVDLKGDCTAVGTHIGPTFVVANHPALQHRGDKSLTVTRVRSYGEDDDGFKLTLFASGKSHNLVLKEIITDHDLSSGPVRPVGNELFDSLNISPGPNW
jgi:hypothetical protein